MSDMNRNIKNKQGGFLQLILILVIFFFLVSYFDISVSDFFNWLKTLIQTIFLKLNLG